MAADAAASAAPGLAPVGIQQLVETLLGRVRLRPGAAATGSGSGGGGSVATAPGKAQPAEPFLFYIDHCFAIRGQGTVLTGGSGRPSRAQQERHAASYCKGMLRRVVSRPPCQPCLACTPSVAQAQHAH